MGRPSKRSPEADSYQAELARMIERRAV